MTGFRSWWPRWGSQHVPPASHGETRPGGRGSGTGKPSATGTFRTLRGLPDVHQCVRWRDPARERGEGPTSGQVCRGAGVHACEHVHMCACMLVHEYLTHTHTPTREATEDPAPHWSFAGKVAPGEACPGPRLSQVRGPGQPLVPDQAGGCPSTGQQPPSAPGMGQEVPSGAAAGSGEGPAHDHAGEPCLSCRRTGLTANHRPCSQKGRDTGGAASGQHRA